MRKPWLAVFLLTVLTGLLITLQAQVAVSAITVFECKYPDFSFFVTIYDDGSPARVGIEQGLGDKAQAYFDKLTGAWIIVEFMADGTLPTTLTTILSDGDTWHSRHTLDVLGNIAASQFSGTCTHRSIP